MARLTVLRMALQFITLVRNALLRRIPEGVLSDSQIEIEIGASEAFVQALKINSKTNRA